MAEASDVVRTRRVEVVDEKGRVRVVLGLVGQGDGPMFGMVVKDQRGRDRVWALHDRTAVEIGLDYDGNTVAALTVADDGTPRLVLDD